MSCIPNCIVLYFSWHLPPLHFLFYFTSFKWPTQATLSSSFPVCCCCLTVCLSTHLCSKQKASKNAGSPWTNDDSCTSRIHWYDNHKYMYTHTFIFLINAVRINNKIHQTEFPRKINATEKCCSSINTQRQKQTNLGDSFKKLLQNLMDVSWHHLERSCCC